MSEHTSSLLEEIEAFLAASGMGSTYFGKAACGNSELVARLRDGRPCLTTTSDRIRYFIRKRSEKSEETAA